MLISEVMEQTGLSKKAIRFYEDKGLIKVARKENGYREYSENEILTLKKIKSLRMCGISVSDIKLLFGNIVSLDDLLHKRKKEIESEHGLRFSQLDTVSQIIDSYKNNEFDLTGDFDETAIHTTSLSDKLAVGIDIGSTTISATVMDIANNVQVESYTINNGADIQSQNSQFYEQDAVAICNKAIKLLTVITENYADIRTIGVTGQMHGIVYIDKMGNAVSNLITWQDKRADENLANGYSYCDKIFEITGKEVYTGFGMATHYYNCINNMVPPTAHSFCSIMDYLVMKLTDTTDPVLHSSVAASFGLFDISKSDFDTNAISKLKIDNLIFPKVTDAFYTAGRYKNIPVSIAIGDNQASFIGSVENIDDTILINIGTGSQISMVTDCPEKDEKLELRPLIKDKYILCGSALCGGKAYAVLEKFFREYMLAFDTDAMPQYEIINKLSYEAYMQGKDTPLVEPSFRGKRSDPLQKATIMNITEENFTPAQLVLGFIKGICKELYDFVGVRCKTKKQIVASGNAVRKIPIMKSIISDMFGLPVKVSDNKEEASAGAALFASLTAGLTDNIYKSSSIKNKGENTDE